MKKTKFFFCDNQRDGLDRAPDGTADRKGAGSGEDKERIREEHGAGDSQSDECRGQIFI